MNFKKGILYCLSNPLWQKNIYKIGNTGQNIKSRVSTIQTSLYLDCEIVYQTNELICCIYYEKILEKILLKYRINPKREFYFITEEEIKLIFDFFNELNNQFDNEEKLLKYIQEINPEYLNKKRFYIQEIISNEKNYDMCHKFIGCKNENSSSEKPKRKKKGLYVNTSY